MTAALGAVEPFRSTESGPVILTFFPPGIFTKTVTPVKPLNKSGLNAKWALKAQTTRSRKGQQKRFLHGFTFAGQTKPQPNQATTALR